MSTFAHQFDAVPSDRILMPQPNKTKPPLQVLAVVEGNGEKTRFRIKHVMGGINWIKHEIIYSYITSHFSHFLSTAGLESVSNRDRNHSFGYSRGQRPAIAKSV